MQQRFGRAGRDTRSLKLNDFFALAADLHAHALDLRTEEFECGHILLLELTMSLYKNETRTMSQDCKMERSCRVGARTSASEGKTVA
ncbi:hypothetical protein [Bradyrhizobium tropiciagri]|uniref:hypothetical protein n=1 Tax=Bradyrhizobium tropiciagri TaxID=312253 RepID=UPI00067C9ADD|nr:hypothetical protein [Bradyrhizobium tropiciagri]